MRNVLHLSAQLNTAEVGEEGLLPFLATDGQRGWTFVLSKENVLFAVDTATNEETLGVPLETDSLLEAGSTVVGMHYVEDQEVVCLATLEGEIVTVNVVSGEAEVVGALDAGIVAMAWSPDDELVLFVTSFRSIVQMTADWEPVTEVDIPGTGGEVGDSPPPLEKGQVDLSWRGDAKVFACTVPGVNGEYAMHVFDRACVHEACSVPAEVKHLTTPQLAWRPSGSVIAATQRLPHRYEVAFFERNGLRHGEFTIPEVGSEGGQATVESMAWNAASDILSLLVTTEAGDCSLQMWHMNNYHWYLKLQITRGLKGSDREIVAAQWDPENAMKLSIALRAGDIEEHELYWDTNVCSALGADNHTTVSVIDGTNVLLTPMRFLVPPPPMCAATLPLPQPEGVTLSRTANAVTFSPKGNFLATCSDGALLLFSPSEATSSSGRPRHDIPPSLKRSLLPPKCLEGSILLQATFLSESTIGMVCSVAEEDTDGHRAVRYTLCVMEIPEGVEDEELVLVDELELPCRALRLYSNVNTSTTLLSMSDKSVMEVEAAGGASFALTKREMLPMQCKALATVTFGADITQQGINSMGDGEKGKEVVVAHSSLAGRLYVASFECSRECNSFAVHNEFLLFTTMSSSLRMIDTANQEFSEAALDTTQVHAYDTTGRQVENGSRIVAVVPHSSRVVLQMPRGNLETIYPRALLLSTCRQQLKAGEYGTAFREMRRHRVDLNLLCDFEPRAFEENLESVIRQIDNPQQISVFVSGLREADVTRTLFVEREQKRMRQMLPSYLLTDEELALLYEEQGRQTPEEKGKSEGEEDTPTPITAKFAGRARRKGPGKVNRVCTAVRKALRAVDEERYLLTILTTYVKQEPPRLEEVLRIVQGLKREADNSRKGKKGTAVMVVQTAKSGEEEKGPSKEQHTAEAALNYLVFLVDVQKLYQVALGMYDFELAVMVAQKSQMDPKEYLPDLTALAKLQPLALRKATIDERLEKWETALRHLAPLCMDPKESLTLSSDCENASDRENDSESLSVSVHERSVELALEERDSVFEKSITLLRAHPSLFPLAAHELFKSSPSRLLAVRLAHAEHLEENREYENAAELFWQSGEEEKAVDLYVRHTENWRLALARATASQHYSSEAVESLAREMAANYRNLARFEDSARILLDYCGDANAAISALISGCKWEEALRLTTMYPEAVASKEGALKSALLEAHEQHVTLVASKHQAYHSMVERLRLVKRNKLLFPQLVQGPDRMNSDGVFSDTSSFASSTSSFSYVSVSSGGTRRRKKKKKKRISGKEGSRYEEEYLIHTLKQQVPTTSAQEEVRDLLRGLVQSQCTTEARALQALYAQYIEIVEASLDILLSPLIGVPGEEEENATTEQKLHEKSRLDSLYSRTQWRQQAL